MMSRWLRLNEQIHRGEKVSATDGDEMNEEEEKKTQTASDSAGPVGTAPSVAVQTGPIIHVMTQLDTHTEVGPAFPF